MATDIKQVCQSCGVNLEFNPDEIGDQGHTILCPNCSQPVTLVKPPPILRGKARPNPVVWIVLVCVLGMVCMGLFLYIAKTSMAGLSNVRVQINDWDNNSIAFAIFNDTPVAIKDVAILFQFKAQSGTALSHQTVTVYHTVKAHDFEYFSDRDLGFPLIAPAQATRVSAAVVAFKPLDSP